jgi:hypothetical protein
VQCPENIDVWDPATDEGAAPPIPSKPSVAEIETPSIDTALAIGLNGSVYLRFIITEPTRDDLQISVKYRVKDIGGGVPGAWVEQKFVDWDAVSGLVTVNTAPVPSGQLLQHQLFLIGPVDSVAPSPVNTLVATGGVGQVAFTWNSPNSANFASTAFYRNTVNTEGTASLISPQRYGSPNSAQAWTDTGLAAGTYYYWLRARNGSLVESTSVASGAKVVT